MQKETQTKKFDTIPHRIFSFVDAENIEALP